MQSMLKVFVLPAGKAANAPPEPAGEVEIEAETHDALLAAAHRLLSDRGLRVRAVSFTPTGLVAYGEAVG